MTVSPFDHPLLSQLVGDDEVAEFFGFGAELFAAELFERELANACAAEGLIPEASAEAIAERLTDFSPDQERLAAATRRDGLMVPDLIAQMRTHIGHPHGEHLHFGATSQDVLDTGLVLRIGEALGLIEHRLKQVVAQLNQLEETYGKHRISGVTRMQKALPISVADRLISWRMPLVRHLARIEEIKPRLLVLQLGGAVGTLHAFGGKGGAVSGRMASALKLKTTEHAWHSQRDALAEFAGWLSLITGALGKAGQDLALMAQSAIGEASFASAGGSSSMPHKQNPIAAEVLIALARFNATQISAMHQALVHENERSGAAWTLEWMVLPQMVVATSGALLRSQELLGSVSTLGR